MMHRRRQTSIGRWIVERLLLLVVILTVADVVVSWMIRVLPWLLVVGGLTIPLVWAIRRVWRGY